MKKNILKIFVLFVSLSIGAVSGLNAQNFHSKPVAVKNLSDNAKYLSSTLDQLEETDEAQYKINKEKLRFIKKMLLELKTSDSVQEVAENHLPKKDINKIQPAVRFIDTAFANMTPGEYIRTEILFLISY